MRSNTNEFIEKSKLIHGNKYSYEKTVYQTLERKLTITCSVHGDFEQTARRHLRGDGCRKCGNLSPNRAGSKASMETAAVILSRFKDKHGDRYNYGSFHYSSMETPSTILCTEHGEFEQTPHAHLRGSGCPKCRCMMDLSTFLGAAKNSHGDRYDYSKVVFKTSKSKVIITCKRHGDFEQTPLEHTRPRGPCGCPKCSSPKTSKVIGKWLSELGLEFLEEVCIAEFSKFKRFDYYVPSLELYLEYDGVQHHKPVYGQERLVIQQQRDKRRNDWCRDNDVRLLVVRNQSEFNEGMKSYGY